MSWSKDDQHFDADMFITLYQVTDGESEKIMTAYMRSKSVDDKEEVDVDENRHFVNLTDAQKDAWADEAGRHFLCWLFDPVFSKAF